MPRNTNSITTAVSKVSPVNPTVRLEYTTNRTFDRLALVNLVASNAVGRQTAHYKTGKVQFYFRRSGYPLHSTNKAFEETREEVMTHGHAFGTAFGGVFLEGLEVVFIVVALGGLKSQVAAVTDALLSLLVVCIAGVFVRQPLARVPENTLKYAMGVMLTSFGPSAS